MAEQPDPRRRRPADPDGEGAGWVDHDNPDEALVRRRRPAPPAPGAGRPRRPASGPSPAPADRPIRRPRAAQPPTPSAERAPRGRAEATDPSPRTAPEPDLAPPPPVDDPPEAPDADELLFEPFPEAPATTDRPRRRGRRNRRGRAEEARPDAAAAGAAPDVEAPVPSATEPDPLAQDDPDIWTDDAPVAERTVDPTAAVGATEERSGQEPLGWPTTDAGDAAEGADDELAPFPTAGDGSLHHEDDRRRRVAVLVVAALVFGFLGYTIGWARGSSGLTRGQSPTTLVIGGGSSGGVPGGTGTTQPPTTLALPGGDLTTVDFDGGIPRDVNGQAVDVPRGDWQVTDGHAGPASNDPIPADANGPRRYGAGPDLLFDAGKAVSQVDVKLVAPTVYSGVIGRFQDDGNYWAVVADRNLANVSLVLVKDGQQTSKAFVTRTITPGMAIGFLDRDGQITITIDGQPQVLTDFFGTKSSIPDEGIQGNKVGLLAGEGQPQFDDLRFG